jgi:hypothetical protein
MTTASALESLPAAWTPADDAFFRVVASVFPPEFTAGAGALLGSYDDEELALAADAAGGASSERAERTAVQVPV